MKLRSTDVIFGTAIIILCIVVSGIVCLMSGVRAPFLSYFYVSQVAPLGFAGGHGQLSASFSHAKAKAPFSESTSTAP